MFTDVESFSSEDRFPRERGTSPVRASLAIESRRSFDREANSLGISPSSVLFESNT